MRKMREVFARRQVRLAAAASLLAGLGMTATPAWATTRTWDLLSAGSNNGQIDNGSGTWNTTTANWTTNGGTNNSTWSSNDDAIFGGNPGVGTAGTITLSGTLDVNSITFNNAASGNFALTSGTLNFTNVNTSITQSSSSTASIASAITGGDTTLTLGGSGTGTVTISGVISETGGSHKLSLTKSGNSTYVLTGTNTYTGTTNINGGTLTLDGSIASGSTVNVATAGTLAGTGTVNGNATLTGNGVINFGSGGSIVGTLGVTGGNWNGLGSVTGAITSSSGAFTIGSGANLTANGNLNVTGGTLAAADATSTITGSVNYTSASSSTWAGVIAGAGKTLTLNNAAATLTLTGTNTYTGATNITAGNLVVNGSIASGSTVNVATAGTLSGTGTVNGNATITGAGIINFGVGGNIAGTLAINNGGNWNGVGTVAGAVSTPSSSGTFTIGSGANLTAPAGVNISLGMLAAGSSSSTITGSLNYTSAMNSTWGGVIAGSTNTLTLNRNNTVLTLSGANTHGGDTRITDGTITLANVNALQNSTLDMNAADLGPLSFKTITASTLGGLKGSRNIALANDAASAVALSVGNNNASTTYSGSLSGAGSLVKIGGGALTLSGSSSYTGATTINGGTLNVTGTVSGAGGNVDVNSGAKLTGTGTIQRNLNVNSGGTLSPAGDGTNSNVGTLSVGRNTSSAHTFGANSTYAWEIKDATAAAGTGYDTLSVTGTLTVGATSGSPMIVKLISHGPVTNWSSTGVYHWDIATATTVSGFSADKFVLDTTDFADDNPTDIGSSFSVDNGVAGRIRVSYTPEPGSSVILGAAGAAATLRRRRRSRDVRFASN
jgi:autotransporter-associated beta strand protein